ncbi:unnamed protein product [Adineta steineri]|uniref:Uncharacterized protein n=1 Tax=Adineta steineri TaxID=433720 RepID=A0A814JB31_9BILA|nr:unnamed protein product [Adineta steineri]CAF3700817.1 unnamed protein product [Adineta steineri]
MAKFVIAGKTNCPLYAKAELLGDYLQRNLPNFVVHKWPIDSKDWDNWVKSTCEKNQWKAPRQSSPLIWRELIDRGGRGALVGDLDDFQEYVHCYYGSILNHFMTNTSALFRSIAEENAQQYIRDLELNEQHIKQTVNPYHICIIGADHPCAYGLFPDLLSSDLFPNRDICLRLTTHDPTKLSSLEAIAMEIEDLACKQFRTIEISLQNNDKFSYENTDFILILDDYFNEEKQKYFDSLVKEKATLNEGYDKENLFADERPPFKSEKMKYDIKQAYNYYKTLANQIQLNLKSTCRILLACSNSIMIATHAFIKTIKTIPTNQIIGLARIIENQAKARIGKKLSIDIKNVVDLHIVGDINGEYIIDTNNCQAVNYEGAIWAKTFLRDSTEMLADSKFIKEVIGKEVENRDFELYTYVEQNRTLVHTQAKAILSFIQDWINGSNNPHSYSCVMSCSSSALGLTQTNDETETDKNIICSVPVLMKGQDEILPVDLNLSNDNRTALTRILKVPFFSSNTYQ